MPSIDIDRAETIVYWVVGTIFAIATAVASVFGLKKKGSTVVEEASIAQVANELMMNDKISVALRDLGAKYSEDRRRIYNRIEEQDRDLKQEIAELEQLLKLLQDQITKNAQNIAVLLDRDNRDRPPPRRRT